jgi:hypothetical protein
LIDPARLCIALGPLAVYLLVIGALNLSRRPFVTTGARDLLALGVGLCGVVLVGPIELLTDTRVVLALGPSYWLLVLGLYASGWLTLALHCRPRIVVYNVTCSALQGALEEAAREIDAGAYWAGQTLVLPSQQAQLLLEPFSPLRNASIVALGDVHNPSLWRHLETALRSRLASSAISPGGVGLAMLMISAALFTLLASQWLYDPVAVTRGLMEMLGKG